MTHLPLNTLDTSLRVLVALYLDGDCQDVVKTRPEVPGMVLVHLVQSLGLPLGKLKDVLDMGGDIDAQLELPWPWCAPVLSGIFRHGKKEMSAHAFELGCVAIGEAYDLDPALVVDRAKEVLDALSTEVERMTNLAMAECPGGMQ